MPESCVSCVDQEKQFGLGISFIVKKKNNLESGLHLQSRLINNQLTMSAWVEEEKERM